MGNPKRKVRKVDGSTSIFSNFLKTTLPFAFGGSEDPITKIILDEFGPQTYIYALTKSGQVQVYLVPKGSGAVQHIISNSHVTFLRLNFLKADLQTVYVLVPPHTC